MASTAAVRIFELVCLSLWVYGIIWVRRSQNPVYAGVYTGSTLLVGWDWIFNSKWFFRVEFDDKFIALFKVQGVGGHPPAVLERQAARALTSVRRSAAVQCRLVG